MGKKADVVVGMDIKSDQFVKACGLIINGVRQVIGNSENVPGVAPWSSHFQPHGCGNPLPLWQHCVKNSSHLLCKAGLREAERGLFLQHCSGPGKCTCRDSQHTHTHTHTHTQAENNTSHTVMAGNHELC